MGRSWQYPRWRRYAMQATMWLVLGATLGLAALVNHERRRSLRVELGPPATYGPITVRLPRAWDVIGPSGSDSRIVVSATEPTADPARRPGPGRMVTIFRERLPAARGPLEHLLISISQPAAVSGPAEWADAVESVTIGGWPGLMVGLTKMEPAPRPPLNPPSQAELPDGSRPAWPRSVYVACAVLPSRHAIVIQLEGGSTNDLSDVEVLKQIAAAIEITGQPPLGQPGETVALEGGARVTAPEGFRPVYEDDPNRVERQLWDSGDARSWTSCELVPIVLASETGDETAAITTALQTRDRRLGGAKISTDGRRRWRIDPPPSPFRSLFPSVAYLIADEHGDRGGISAGPRRAVLAVFRGAPGTERRFEQAWDAVARGVTFVGETNFAAMLAAGESEARRLSDRGMARLMRAPRDQQWWLWYDEDEHVNLGWSVVAWDLSGPPAQAHRAPIGAPAPWGERRTKRRGPDGRILQVNQEWTGDLQTYGIFSDTIVGDSSETSRQTVRLDDGELVMTETAARNKRLGNWQRLAPAQFVPGGWLSLVIGELSRQPMILKTESFVGREGSAPPEPMTLIVTHGADATTRSAVDGTPLRCVTVAVNGSGEVSRWFFREDGRTERIELAAGLRLLPSDGKTVSFTFEHDEGMSP